MDHQLPASAIIKRLEWVCQWSGLSKSTLNERIARGAFPKPVKLSPRTVGWRLSDLLAWCEELEVAR